jgi:hypothetical protein
MKKITQIIVAIAVFLVTQTIAFAQPTDLGSSSNSTDTNQTDLPVDDFIWVLIIVGIAYVFSKFNRSKA